MLVKRGGWAFREVKSKGRNGIRREYQPPPEVAALIEARQRGELPPAAPKASAARVVIAEAPAAPAYQASAPEINVKALTSILQGLIGAMGPNPDPERLATVAVEFYMKVVREGIITPTGIGPNAPRNAA